jgi:glycogen debranching enzyme
VRRSAPSSARRRAAFARRGSSAAPTPYIGHARRGPHDRRRLPWFTDWGRDTFIALRGLCLATGRFDDARAILLAWAGAVSAGMLPNRFPDRGDVPEFNAVDAALWFVVAAHEYVAAHADAGELVPTTSNVGFARRLTRFSTATPTARASAFAATATVSSPRVSRACSSRGWTPRSATGW